MKVQKDIMLKQRDLTMKKSVSKCILFYTLSFAIPAVIILSALVGLKITPFGDRSLAISDGRALYLNYLGYVGRALRGQEDFIFSFEKGLGGNMMGSWGWFLLNPLFALFALFDIVNYLGTYTLVSLLNFCVCGLTMYVLLKDIYGHKVSNLIFSTAYAMNGFLVANVFQMNFFSVIPILPLMVMGLRRILNDKNPIIYILSISYSLLTNFYFGFMLCVASFLIFIVFFVLELKRIGNKKVVAAKYIVSSFLGGIVSSVVWIPALNSLRGGRLDQPIAYAISLKENMPFLDIIAKMFTGANSTAELSNGLPNIYVGILPFFLVILFFVNQKIHSGKKVAAGVLIGFYLISFYMPVLNILMHGGTITNWFNYRDSFVFCFLLLMIAANEWQYIMEEPLKSIKTAALIMILIIVVVFSKNYEFVTGGAVIIDLVILVFMALAYWMHKKDPIKNPKRVFAMVVLVLMCVNLFLNYYICTKNIQVWDIKETEYQENVIPVSAMVEAVKNSDNTVFRMEIGDQLSGNLGNDPMLYGYYGVGHGGSDDRDFVRTALSKLGVRRFNMRNSYGKGIPAATDTLLGLKYIISKEDLTEEKGYEKKIGIGDWMIYNNPYALPIAFMTDSEIENIKIDLEDIFINLNRLWSAMAGNKKLIFIEEKDIFFESHNYFDSGEISKIDAEKIVNERDASTTSSSTEDNHDEDNDSGRDIELEKNSGSDSGDLELQNEGSFREPPADTSYIKYTIKVHRDGPVYSYNRSGMTEDNGSATPTLMYEGYYHVGDTITRYLPVPGNIVSQSLLEDVAGRFKTAYVDMDVLTSMAKEIQERPSTIDKIADSHLKGTFTVESGQELMFTIPYDEGWTLTVDGKETEIKKVLDVFMVADVEPGEHTYEMKFIPSGLREGIIISLIGLIGIVIFMLFELVYRGKINNRIINKKSLESLQVVDDRHLMGNNDVKISRISKNAIPVSGSKHGQTNSVYLMDELPNSFICMILVTLSFIICMKSSYNLLLPYKQGTDSSVFEYIGWMMNRGGIMYKDTFDHKGPLLYFLNWLGVLLGGKTWNAVGIIELCIILISSIFSYCTIRLFVNRLFSAIGAIIVMLFLFPYFESGNMVEEYALPFIIGALFVFSGYFLNNKISKTAVVICGFCFGCVLLLRQNMIALWIVFATAVIIKEWKNKKRLVCFGLCFLIGTIISLLPFVFYLSVNHALSDCIEQYIMFNFRYSDTANANRISTIFIWMIQPSALIITCISIILLIVKYKRKKLCVLNLLYHLVNVALVGIAGTSFLHYGMALIPGCVLAIAMLLEFLSDYVKKQYILVGTTIVASVLMIPWLKFIIIDLPMNNTYRYLDKASIAAAMIWDNTNPDDKIIVCGNRDRIYLEAEREAASVYSYQLPIGEHDPKIFEKFAKDLEKNEPEVVVLDSNNLIDVLDYENLNKVVDKYLKSHQYYQWGDLGTITVLGKHKIDV